MPRYFFHSKDGVCDKDPDGQELPNVEAARLEAVMLLAETLRHKALEFWKSQEWSITVDDDRGDTLFRLKLYAEAPGAARSAGAR